LIPAADNLPPENKSGLEKLQWVVERLLGPGGCPWDRAQTHESLKKYLLEEAYEVCDAIDRQDSEALKEELGDLLLQPLMHAQISKGRGEWGIEDVAEAEADKLIRRHPHVFGSAHATTPEEVLARWDETKRNEPGRNEHSILAGLPRAMPSLARADEISRRAARVGFDWPDRNAVLAKLDEEREELARAIQTEDRRAIEHEIGDLLFCLVNLARWSGVDPEDALRAMLDRFCRRFAIMERLAGKDLTMVTLAEWDELWERAKLEVGSEG
jgi:tetrapyrrole methylase family protein/MazG family protein